MSIVIIGGHERMETQYKEICKKYKCKAKVFTKMRADLSRKIGCPDLMILFTSTASHKLINCAVTESERNHAALERSHSSSATALKGILEQYA